MTISPIEAVRLTILNAEVENNSNVNQELGRLKSSKQNKQRHNTLIPPPCA